jgi:Protein of unknown function (DUF2934)
MSGKNGKAPSTEAIELRAYQIYVERGRMDGDDLADWLAAERQLTVQAESAASERQTNGSLRTGQRKRRPAKAA